MYFNIILEIELLTYLVSWDAIWIQWMQPNIIYSIVHVVRMGRTRFVQREVYGKNYTFTSFTVIIWNKFTSAKNKPRP